MDLAALITDLDLAALTTALPLTVLIMALPPTVLIMALPLTVLITTRLEYAPGRSAASTMEAPRRLTPSVAGRASAGGFTAAEGSTVAGAMAGSS
jgi:hypothetical protein